jgi:putative ABC transport system ATP-binding protein
MPDEPILHVTQLSKIFPTAGGPLTVLDSVDFALPAGSTCAIIGPSGSGKTTLLGLCAGLDRPSSGSVVLAGHPLHTVSEDERARIRNREVGFVFQNFQLIPTLTALENVMVPLELQGDGRARGRSIELLEMVGLAARHHHYPGQLSGGEQQRVAIARAFSNRPKILFADEPTGNLDTTTAAAVVDSLFELNRSFGTALVLVTHDLELARLAQQVFRMKGGAIVSREQGQPAEQR